MDPSTNDSDWDRVGRAVREAAPPVPEVTAAEQAALWRRIASTATPAPRRRAGVKAALVGLVAVAAVGGAGAATAGVFSAHTGRGPVDAEDVELGGPGERLDPDAPDFARVIDEISADVEFPSAAARQRAVAWESTNYSDGGATVSTGAIRLWMAGHAICSWTDVWAVALRTGDTATEREAARRVLDARTWTAITDTDPDMANESEFDWLPEVARAIEADDPVAARRVLERNQSCMPGLAPELGMGVPR